MAHSCKALMLHCMDFRFIDGLNRFIADLGLNKNCDVISFAGGGGALVKEGTKDILLEQISLSHELHGIERIILVNHLDCGAYGGSEAFDSSEEERQKHTDDLAAAKMLVESELSNVKVEIVLASVVDDKVEFERLD